MFQLVERMASMDQKMADEKVPFQVAEMEELME